MDLVEQGLRHGGHWSTWFNYRPHSTSATVYIKSRDDGGGGHDGGAHSDRTRGVLPLFYILAWPGFSLFLFSLALFLLSQR